MDAIDEALRTLRVEMPATPGAGQALDVLEQLAATWAALDKRRPRTLGRVRLIAGGRNRSSVHRHLAALERAGLAKRESRGWVRVELELDAEPTDGARRCSICRSPLQPFGGRLYCMNASCPGESR
jgi:hypothetical protein